MGTRGRLITAVVVVISVLFVGVVWRGRDAAPTRVSSSRTSERATSTHRLRIPRPPANAAIHGNVRSKQGALLGAARVCATCVSCEITGSKEQRCSDTRADGSYTLEDLGPSGYRVTASYEGYAVAVASGGRPFYLAAGEQRRGVDLELAAAGGSVRGLVLDATGGPIARASVRLVTWGAQPAAIAVETDDEGRFTAALAAGRFTAIASAPDYAPARIYTVAPTESVKLVLTPEATISGRVTTADGQELVGGARVGAVAQGTAAAAMRETVSADDGSFTIGGLEPGVYRVVATAPGLAGSATETVALEIGDAVADLSLRLTRATQVSGRVLVAGEIEQPCESGLVMLGPPDPGLSLRDPKWTKQALAAQPMVTGSVTAPISADGKVQFDAVPPGSYFASVLCDDHRQTSGPATVTVTDVDLKDLVWHVIPNSRLTVLVVDEANRPMPGARVDLKWPESEAQDGSVTGLEAGPDGRTPPVTHLYPGVYTATAVGGYEAEPVTIELAAGARDVQGTLRLKGRGAIEVEVRDHANTPRDDLRVVARPCAASPADPAPSAATPSKPPALTSALPQGLGRYRIGPLSSGCYRVEVSDSVNTALVARTAENRSEVQVSGNAPVQLQLRIDRGATLNGRVIGADGQPLADTWVSAVASGEAVDARRMAMQRRLSHAANRVLSDGEGRFAIGELDSASTYDVTAEQPGGASVVARGVRAADVVTLTVPSAGAIEGLVTDPRGQALEDFTLSVVESATQRGVTRAFVSAEGRFAVDGVTPGQLEVRAVDPKGQIAELRAELRAGERLRGLRLVLAD